MSSQNLASNILEEEPIGHYIETFFMTKDELPPSPSFDFESLGLKDYPSDCSASSASPDSSQRRKPPPVNEEVEDSKREVLPSMDDRVPAASTSPIMDDLIDLIDFSDFQSADLHLSGFNGDEAQPTTNLASHSCQHQHATLEAVEDSTEEVLFGMDNEGVPSLLPPADLQSLGVYVSGSTGRDDPSTNPTPLDSIQHHHLNLIPSDPVEDSIEEVLFAMNELTGGDVPSANPASDSIQHHQGPVEDHPSTTTALQCFGHHHDNYHFIQLPYSQNKRQKTSSEPCNCKNSQCLQRYCECFAAGKLCGQDCTCQDCFNKLEYEMTILREKKNNILCKNPSAFDKRVDHGKLRIGCNCIKSECSNGFRPCHKAKFGCSDLCRCKNCKNSCGSKTGGKTASSDFNLTAAQRDLALLNTPKNNIISSVNDRQLGGGLLETLAHNNFTPFGSANHQRVLYGAPVPPNPFQVQHLLAPSNNIIRPAPPAAVAQQQENPFVLSNNIIRPPPAAMAQQQANPFAPASNVIGPLPASGVQQQGNSFAPASNIIPPSPAAMVQQQANPFAPSTNIIRPSPAATVQQQANPFAPSSYIRPPRRTVQMAATAQPQGNAFGAHTLYRPQQLMNPANQYLCWCGL